MKTFARGSTIALAIAAFAMACADSATGPQRALLPDGVTRAITMNLIDFPGGGTYPPGVADGVVRLCKTANAAETFNFTVTSAGGGTIVAAPQFVFGAGGGTSCQTVYTSNLGGNSTPDQVVITEGASPANWALTNIDVVQHLGLGIFNAGGYTGFLGDTESEAGRVANVFVNGDMARTVTFTNTFTPPPVVAICDFITFGRLVDEVGGIKVVISGNAGGLNADGSIKGEFHIDVNGVDHHVHDVSTYGPIAAAPLASSSFTNSRRVTGTDIHGHSVELRLWDGGEPGKDTDRYWFNVNGTIVGNATTGNLIDQGNMQYHPNCRGPDED